MPTHQLLKKFSQNQKKYLIKRFLSFFSDSVSMSMEHPIFPFRRSTMQLISHSIEIR